MYPNVQPKVVETVKDQDRSVMVPGGLLVFVSSEAVEPHLNLRLPHKDLLAGVMSALRRDSGGNVCVADRFIPALEYAQNPAHVFALFANHLLNLDRGLDEPAPPAESPVVVDRAAEWYSLPVFFFVPHSMIPEFGSDVVDLEPKTVEAIDATLRAITGCAPCVLEFLPTVMHRALVPVAIEDKMVAAIRTVAKRGKLREIPSPLPDEVIKMARWPLYLTMPTEDYQSRPVPEVRLSRSTDPEIVARIQAAGWRVRFPKAFGLVH